MAEVSCLFEHGGPQQMFTYFSAFKWQNLHAICMLMGQALAQWHRSFLPFLESPLWVSLFILENISWNIEKHVSYASWAFWLAGLLSKSSVSLHIIFEIMRCYQMWGRERHFRVLIKMFYKLYKCRKSVQELHIMCGHIIIPENLALLECWF